MAYYVLQGKGGMDYNPGFMQNVSALGNAMGKNINSKVFSDAAASQGLIPEYDIDQSTGDVKTSYKSPQLINRGFYSPGAPGNPSGKPGQSNQSVTKALQDAIAQNAIKNAQDETANYPEQLKGSPAGAPSGTIQQADGTLVDPEGKQVGEAPLGQAFEPKPDQNKIFQEALMQQANDNPLVNKSLGLPGAKAPGKKQTLDSDIAEAQAGKQTWADVIHKYPTKIKQIQQARRGLSNQSDSTPQQAAVEQQATTSKPKQLTPDIAAQILQQAGGDKDKARQIAAQQGYSF